MNGPIYHGYTEDQQLTTEDVIRRNARQWGHDPDQAVADFRREKAFDRLGELGNQVDGEGNPLPSIQMQTTEGPLASSQG